MWLTHRAGSNAISHWQSMQLCLTSREWNAAPVHKCPHPQWSLCSSYRQSTQGDTCILQPPTDRKGKCSAKTKSISVCSYCLPLIDLVIQTSELRSSFYWRVSLAHSAFPEPHPCCFVCKTSLKQTCQHAKQSLRPGTSVTFGSSSAIKNSW